MTYKFLLKILTNRFLIKNRLMFINHIFIPEDSKKIIIFLYIKFFAIYKMLNNYSAKYHQKTKKGNKKGSQKVSKSFWRRKRKRLAVRF